MDAGWFIAFAGLVAASAVAGAAFLWGSLRARNAVGVSDDTLRAAFAKLSATLEEERASMRRDFASALEEASGIGETVSRHRNKVDAAERRREQREAREAAAQPHQLTIMDVHRAARAAGKL